MQGKQPGGITRKKKGKTTGKEGERVVGEERKKNHSGKKKVIRGGLSPIGFSVLIILGRNH